jgi:hypothetical protein
LSSACNRRAIHRFGATQRMGRLRTFPKSDNA